jgi:GcrA cell cycle regulator
MENSNWSDERVERLETLYRDGLSFSLIASEIGVTRSAAIGKAHRMRLPRRGELTDRLPPRPKLVSASESNARRRRLRALRAAAANLANKKVEVFVDPDRDYRCSINDLRDTTCRYPTWDLSTPHAARLYCGAPGASVSCGVPYCKRHALLCDVSKG